MDFLSDREKSVATEIVEACRRLYDRNMLAAADGNLSFRMSDQRVMITPTGLSKAFLKADQMAVMDMEGNSISGQPSSEKLMHLEVYRRCEKAQFVVHAHPPTAVAWSIARPQLKELPSSSLSEVILAVGAIPFVPYARPGSSQMAEVLQPYLPQYRTMILSRHGALTWGESLQEAVGGMERIEHSCEILARAESLGGLTDLPEEEVLFLKSLREKIGERIL